MTLRISWTFAGVGSWSGESPYRNLGQVVPRREVGERFMLRDEDPPSAGLEAGREEAVDPGQVLAQFRRVRLEDGSAGRVHPTEACSDRGHGSLHPNRIQPEVGIDGIRTAFTAHDQGKSRGRV